MNLQKNIFDIMLTDPKLACQLIKGQDCIEEFCEFLTTHIRVHLRIESFMLMNVQINSYHRVVNSYNAFFDHSFVQVFTIEQLIQLIKRQILNYE